MMTNTQQPAPAAAGGAATPYRVRLDLFEGPLDLLLHLIKRNEVDISDIPIATITEQYLAYLDVMRELNLDVAGEFLVMAATLTLVKSRMLLPSAEPEDDDEGDPRADLVRQLIDYQRYREASESLGERPRLLRDVFTRKPSAEGVSFDRETGPVISVTMWELIEAFRGALKRARPDYVQEVESEAVSLRDRIEDILRTLSVARSVIFESLFGESVTRGFVIVTFLAVLELMKLGAVEACQEEQCGPILIVLSVDDVSGITLDLADEYDGMAIPPVSEDVPDE